MIKKIGIALVAAALALSLCGAALAEGRTLTVEGGANVTLAADYATLVVGAQTKSDSVSAAQKENAERMGRVLEAIKAFGIADEDASTQSFDVYSYEEGNYGETQRTVYVMTNTLSVTVRDIGKVGALLDTVMNAGANVLNALSFDSTARNDAYQKALGRAVEDAMEKAKVLSAAADVQLGDILSVQSGETYAAVGLRNTYAYEAGGVSKDTAINGGDISVGATVTITYAIQ